MSHLRTGLLITYITLLVGCASVPTEQCPTGTLNLPDCPPVNAINDEDINKLHASRTWIKPSKLTIDPIQMGQDAQIPVNNTRVKIIGPGQVDALNSLAAKIWLIDNAQHTIDLTYYIFKTDMVGYAVLGALCNAVQRGVDIRIMVDSLGSFSFGHNPIRALETCAEKAGFIRNLDGQVTTKKARVQAVIFNALSNFEFNRRSHDKLLVVDGHVPDKAFVMTGGRNIYFVIWKFCSGLKKIPRPGKSQSVLPARYIILFYSYTRVINASTLKRLIKGWVKSLTTLTVLREKRAKNNWLSLKACLHLKNVITTCLII
jgi:hypothetical protein